MAAEDAALALFANERREQRVGAHTLTHRHAHTHACTHLNHFIDQRFHRDRNRWVRGTSSCSCPIARKAKTSRLHRADS
eukprot:1161603-Pelagomonas_calceolata.AAC.19